jgi:prepilin-type N-terminal cleavage/methylation domain-containing protein
MPGVEAVPERTPDGESGMTIIEVMVAMVVLLVGMAGTLVLLAAGVSSTNSTSAREGATNLAREVVERSRQAPYKDITKDTAATRLAGMLPEAPSVTGSTFTVTRRKTTYTVTVSACSIDDPTDGAGVGDATFCATPNSTNTPGSPAPGYQVGLNVLGVTVSAGGSLLETICQAVVSPSGSVILNQLTGAVSNVTPITVCPGTLPGSVAFDSTPADLRRVRVDVAWTTGHAGAISQTTLLTNPTQRGADPSA